MPIIRQPTIIPLAEKLRKTKKINVWKCQNTFDKRELLIYTKQDLIDKLSWFVNVLVSLINKKCN